MNIQDKNNIIARYMNITTIKGISNGNVYYYYNNETYQDFEPLPNYDQNWGCLMEVVEKINVRDWVTIYADECKINSLIIDEFQPIINNDYNKQLIENVFESVYEYVDMILKRKER